MANYNLSLPAETIDELLIWLDDNQGTIIKQTDLLTSTGQSTTATMTQKAITDALGTKADASDVYTKTETDTLLAAKQDKDTDAVAGNVAVMDAGGNSVDGGVPLADLATKAEVAVVAGEAGLAEAVIDTDNAGTEQEFTFRKSGGDGGAYYRKIKGKTLAWNQLAVRANSSAEVYGITRTANGNALHYSGTSTNSTNFTGTGQMNFKASHKYYYAGIGIPATCGISAIVGSSTVGVNSDIYQPSQDEQRAFGVYIPSGVSIDNDVLFVCRDLTQMFGAGNEPSSVEEFEALYPLSYDVYNPGTLISNDAEAVETTGFNQWGGELENGYWDVADGTAGAGAQWKRSKEPIPVFPSTDYYWKVLNVGATGGYLLYYDANMNYLGYSNAEAIQFNAVHTTPANCRFMHFYLRATYTESDICINISNAAINGQYFPYWKRDLQLNITTRKDTDGNVPFADGMKGAGTAADWADKVGGEKRMGRVDLGSATWTARGGGVFSTTIPGLSYNGVCAKYAILYSGTPSSAGDKTLSMVSYYAAGGIYIKDSAFDGYTGAQVAEALSGVMLDYELAAPVPFTWAEPLNLGVKVDENGTERAVAPEGATNPSAPFVADTTYTMSVARMVEILKNL